MHTRGAQDRYFNSLRNRIKMGTVVSTPAVTIRRCAAPPFPEHYPAGDQFRSKARRASSRSPKFSEHVNVTLFRPNIHVSASHF
jgi:hypothetical protein